MKKVLITGGAGYIGTVLTERLLEKGYKVSCLDRLYFGEEFIFSFIANKNYNFIKKDITHVTPKDLEGYEAVIDLAGISNDPACDLDVNLTKKINHLGTVNIAKCAKDAGVKRYLFASSCSIYGASDKLPLTELSPQKPISLYAKAKIDSEKDILKLNSDDFTVTFLRLATVFGYSHRMRFDLIINIMTKYAIDHKKIIVLGGGKQWRPLIHVKDVARAFQNVLESPINKINGQAFNVGSTKQNYQVYNVANIVKRTIPEKIDIEVAPDDNDKRNYNVNFDKISHDLGFNTRYDVSYGINEVYDAILSGKIDTKNPKFVTVTYYKYLLDAEKILNNIKINGKIFI